MEKQYDYQLSEQSIARYWQENQIYLAHNNPGPAYTIDTPPPTVSGSLHIGHIFSYVQTDIMARCKRMQGFSVFYPFGFDDNGLPTERFVEKKNDIIAHNLTRSAFIDLCLKETSVVEKQFEQLWRAMGLSVDWSACYSTIESSTRKISQESFIRLFNKGYVYRKDEPALYCMTCRTTVSQAELDDKEVTSFFNDLRFKASDGSDLLIGTSRPELLYSCVAVLYNPDDSRYKHLAGMQASVPLYNFQVPILADESVRIDKGTGLVYCATFGDTTDIAWFKKFNLPLKPSIGLDGKWLPETGILAGLRITAAREKIIQELKAHGLLVDQQSKIKNVNVHERCKKEIEYVILPQWFLTILAHKKQFIDLADQIVWHPSFMKSRYQNWVENISWDWCISRQRFFGIPFPAWHCADCKTVLLPSIDQLPVDPQEMAYPGKQCSSCASSNIVPDTDVMDTWNTSSLTPYLCMQLSDKKQKSPFEPASDFLPMSMRPQAHDIIRTWAFDTIVKVWMHDNKIPWKEIIISGHVLADSKEKLSKSKDNSSLTPENLLATYCADAIRYWTASASLGQDVPFSENQLKIGQRLVTKLWNAFKFVHEHTQGIERAEEQDLGIVNEWILHNMSACAANYQRYFQTYEMGLALQQIEQFFWNDFCDNYLELIKNQLFNPADYSAAQVAKTRSTLYSVGLRILQLYAPYIPHITDLLYMSIYKPNEKVLSIHQTKFAVLQKTSVHVESAVVMSWIITIIGQVRKLKTEKQLSLKTELATLTISGMSDEILASVHSQEQLIKGVTQAKTVVYAQQSDTNYGIEQKDDQWHAFIHITAP